jgi:hypothetical protein
VPLHVVTCRMAEDLLDGGSVLTVEPGFALWCHLDPRSGSGVDDDHVAAVALGSEEASVSPNRLRGSYRLGPAEALKAPGYHHDQPAAERFPFGLSRWQFS